MSTLKVKMIDIHEWDAEESPDKRKDTREKMRVEIEKSVRANDGNPGFIKGMLKKDTTSSRKHRCEAVYIWYSIKQDVSKPGESPYTDFSDWQDRAPTWAHFLSTAKGESGGIERKKMKDLIGDDHKTLHSALVEACQKDLDSFEAEQIRKVYPGVVRPKLRLESFKIGQCEVQLGDDDAYNDHMRNLHGVVTTVSDKKHRSGIYPNLNNIPSSNGVEGILNELVPTLKTISAAGGQHVPMNRLKAKPGRKEVEMGIDDLKTVLAADGRVVPGAVTAPLDSYGHITTRMKELVHESDHPVMQRAYAQLAGRRWERGHILKIEHMEKAIREIINKKFQN